MNLEQHLEKMFQLIYDWNKDELIEGLKKAIRSRELVYVYSIELIDEDGEVWSYVHPDTMTPDEYTNYVNSGGEYKYYSPQIPLEILENR